MKPYGPVSVVVNTPFKIGIDASAAVVQIHNNTGLSLRVYFGNAAPASPTYPSQWHATIDPGAHPVLPVNGQQYFDGTLSFYPFNVQGAQSQQAGSISASSFVSVEAYFVGEDPPTSVYSPVFQQGAAQQRVVSVPMPSAIVADTPGLILTQASAYPWLWAYLPIPTGANAITASAGGTNNILIPVYLHHVDITLEQSVAGAAAVYYTLEAALYTSGFVLKAGPQAIYHNMLGTPGANLHATDHNRISHVSPKVITLQVNSPNAVLNTDYVGMRINVINMVGSWNLYVNIGWSADFTNSDAAGYYGGVNPISGLPIAPTSATNPRTF